MGNKAVEEKFNDMMCDFDKILTLIKLFKEMQYEDRNFTKGDLHNISSLLYQQTNLAYQKSKEIECLINK